MGKKKIHPDTIVEKPVDDVGILSEKRKKKKKDKDKQRTENDSAEVLETSESPQKVEIITFPEDDQVHKEKKKKKRQHRTDEISEIIDSAPNNDLLTPMKKKTRTEESDHDVVDNSADNDHPEEVDELEVPNLSDENIVRKSGKMKHTRINAQNNTKTKTDTKHSTEKDHKHGRESSENVPLVGAAGKKEPPIKVQNKRTG